MNDSFDEYAANNYPLRRAIMARVHSELVGLRIFDSEEQQERKKIPPTELKFVPGQPSCLYLEEGGVPYRGQENAKKLLEINIATLDQAHRFKGLLTGAAGTGKTTLAWIIADRIQKQKLSKGLPKGRFFEVLPAQVATKEDLDVFMSQLQAHDIVFIDEIHILKNTVGAEPFYHTLDDTGSPRYPLSEGKGWLDIDPTISWIAATTEPGELDDTTGGALRRRLSPEYRLDPPSLDTLIEIIDDQEMFTDPEAAVEMAKRSGGLPWQVLELYKTAERYARYHQQSEIDTTVAEESFKLLGVDSNGLFPEDRRIINVLLQSPHKTRDGEVKHKMAESALCSAAGVDKNTYHHIVQPRLMRLGFLTTVGGQCLTDKALRAYK